jgi:beta-lactam-binding protein with PASTA domain
MDLSYAAIAILASIVFVLAGMVGYVYWQQTRLLQSLQSIAVYVSRDFSPPQQATPVEPEPQPEPEPETEEQEVAVEDEDDRVEVTDEPILHVTGPKEKEPFDVDDLQGKTSVQLREMLSAKGIPFGKRDSKSVLIELLKATA